MHRAQDRRSSPRHGRSGPGDGLSRYLSCKDGVMQLEVPAGGLPDLLTNAYAAADGGRIDEALELVAGRNLEVIIQAAENTPSLADVVYLMLAMVFQKAGRIDGAREWYGRLLGRRSHAFVLNELASLYQSTGRPSEAIAYRQKALEAEPDNPSICANFAGDLIQAGKFQDGIDLLSRTAQSAPTYSIIGSMLLCYLHYLPELDQKALFRKHKHWGQTHAPAGRAKTAHGNCADPDRALRIGYISPDFYVHSVASFFEPILDGRNPEAARIYGYGNVACPDALTERLGRKFDVYRNVRGLNDDEVTGLTEQDEIDILVDLAGHSRGNRLGVLARKPAPVQVTYLGYPDTTGMAQIDYRLTDMLADGRESQPYYTEELFFLQGGFLCYRPPELSPRVLDLPAERNGYVTFASFNNNCKINPYITSLWAQILHSVEGSRLLLKFKGGDDPKVRQDRLRQFADVGIAEDRVEIRGWVSAEAHLQLYNRVDIALDTYPYNGTATTCEALWMGVPALSLVGKHHASRVGLGILTRMGLDAFACSTPDEYIRKAIAFAGQTDSLARIRESLRPMMLSSPLCDAAGFAAGLEAAYRTMWRRWCGSQRVGFAHIQAEPVSASAYSIVDGGVLNEGSTENPGNAT